MTVTFFGHRDATSSIQSCLYHLLEKMIVEDGADRFFVGDNGAFDAMVKHALEALHRRYKHIDYAVTLAYIDRGNYDAAHSIYPEGLESTPYRYAICKRNEWMIEQSDTVVVYVTRSAGGAARFKEIAERKGKHIIELAE